MDADGFTVGAALETNAVTTAYHYVAFNDFANSIDVSSYQGDGADNRSIASVASKVLPSTVQIVAEYAGKAQGATGSGFVLDDKGHIITNNHVVAEADDDNGPIDVIDQAGNHMKATVVGRSTVYDIAVLDVPKAKGLTPAAVGSADQMRVGETVVAIGSPLGLSATVTSGVSGENGTPPMSIQSASASLAASAAATARSSG